MIETVPKSVSKQIYALGNQGFEKNLPQNFEKNRTTENEQPRTNNQQPIYW
jgi:hypothetical protein